MTDKPAIQPSPEQLERIDVLYAKAFDGPWRIHGCSGAGPAQSGSRIRLFGDGQLAHLEAIVALINAWPQVRAASAQQAMPQTLDEREKHPGLQPCGRCQRTLRAGDTPGTWFCPHCRPLTAPRTDGEQP